MAKKRFYAVKVGEVPGIYETWDECAKQVKGYAGAEYKGFSKLEEAQAYLGLIPTLDKDPVKITRPYAFVDGSFNAETGVYGFGGFISNNDDVQYFIGRGNDEQSAEMRNIAGEIFGSMYAMRLAKKNGLEALDIHYDYRGIEKWANSEWKANKPETKMYKNRVAEYRKSMDVQFVKVDAHTGVEGNEMADKLAKYAVGLIDECPVNKTFLDNSMMKSVGKSPERRTPLTDEELEDMENAYYEAQNPNNFLFGDG